MKTAAPRLDANCCPLCGRANRCAMQIEGLSGDERPPCWCAQAVFQREVLAQVPAPARGLACICSACASGMRLV